MRVDTRTMKHSATATFISGETTCADSVLKERNFQSMTSKDYIKIADVIMNARYVGESHTFKYQEDYRKQIAANFATMLKNDNPAFDTKLFYNACDIELSNPIPDELAAQEDDEWMEDYEGMV